MEVAHQEQQQQQPVCEGAQAEAMPSAEEEEEEDSLDVDADEIGDDDMFDDDEYDNEELALVQDDEVDKEDEEDEDDEEEEDGNEEAPEGEDDDALAEVLSNFCQITGLPLMEARSFLEMSEWDVTRAIEIYYADGQAVSSEGRREESSTRADAAVEQPSERRGVLGRLLEIVRRVTTHRPAATGPEAARQLLLELEPRLAKCRGGRRMQALFVTAGYKRAAQSAVRGAKSLLVYLHSSLHQDNEEFCAEVLCSNDVASCIQRHYVLWGADISSADGLVLSDALRVARYPFLAVLACRPGGTEEVVDRLQGVLDPAMVVDRLDRAAANQRERLEQRRRQDDLRREERRLRSEQDREFEESLENDRRKAEHARLEAERAELDRRRQLDEARERSERLEAEEAAKRRLLERKRARLGEEPPNIPQKTARIRVQLPNGVKVDRRFLADTHTVQHLRDWIDVYLQDNQVNIEEYSLATNYPRRVLGDDLLDLTIRQAELNGKVLYVQDNNA